MPRLLFALSLTLIAGCTTFPELDAAVSADVRSLPFPTIQPLDDLIAQASRPPSAAPATLQARSATLRTRAAVLRSAL